jgi:hypothetical protein
MRINQYSLEFFIFNIRKKKILSMHICGGAEYKLIRYLKNLNKIKLLCSKLF